MNGLDISLLIALLTLMGGLVKICLDYKKSRKAEKESKRKEFYLYTAYNVVIEAENMFGKGHGREKKDYAMTRIQNEALSCGIKWDAKLASTCIEKAVALRNDYKNPGMTAKIEKILDEEMAEQKEEQEENTRKHKKELKKALKEATEVGIKLVTEEKVEDVTED